MRKSKWMVFASIVAMSAMCVPMALANHSEGSGIYNTELHVQNKMTNGTKLYVKDVKIKVKKGFSWTGWDSLGSGTKTISGSNGEYKWKHKYSLKYTYKFKATIKCGNGSWQTYTTSSVMADPSDNDSNYFFVYTGSCSLKKSNDT